MNKLSQVRNNCTKVIRNLPEEQKLIPTESTNSFDMFVNQQVDSTFEYKIRGIEYEAQAQRPFENQFSEFQID